MTDIKSLTLTELQKEMEDLGEKNIGPNSCMAGCMKNWWMILTR